ncbi:MAG: GDP-L-fucose synthase [Spirochaetia bacterium]|jgi:GDP-L-fucose synthase
MDLAGKKILVTGGAGFLGTHLMSAMRQRGLAESDIRVTRREKLDLRVWEDCVSAVSGMEVVIHLAALVGGIGFNRKNPGSIFYDNILMGVQLMEAARLAGVRKLVQIGTVCAYPRVVPVPFRESSLWDGYPEETNAPYGIAKKALLVQAQAYRSQYGFNAIYLLPTNLYGPGDNFDPEDSHVIPALIRKCLEAARSGAREVVLWGSGTASREFLYVEDCAEGILAAAERYDGAEPVNLGSGQEIRISDLVGIIAEECGFSGKIRWDSSKPDGQPRRSLDTSRARSFGFEAITSFKDGLRKTVEWYRSTYSLSKTSREPPSRS